MTGVDMALLRRRVRRCGFNVQQFSYRSIGADVTENAARLQQFVSRLNVETIHFVGHSLGGLLIRQYLHDYVDMNSGSNAESNPGPQIGRIVTLATPHNGSVVATKMAAVPLLRMLLGRSVRRGLDGQVHEWTGRYELGVIAGTLNIGVGRLMSALQGVPGDGSVSVAETRLLGMTDHITLSVSHTAILFSTAVARQLCAFLYDGRFER